MHSTQIMHTTYLSIKNSSWEFPGSPVFRTRYFHCLGQVQSLVRELRCHKSRSVAKTNKKTVPQIKENTIFAFLKNFQEISLRAMYVGIFQNCHIIHYFLWTVKRKKRRQKQGNTAVSKNFELKIGLLSQCLCSFTDSKIPRGIQMLVKFGSVSFPVNDILEAQIAGFHQL